MIAVVKAEVDHNNLEVEKIATATTIQFREKELHLSRDHMSLESVTLIAGPNHQFKTEETTDQRDNTLHQIAIGNPTTVYIREANVEDIEIVTEEIKEKTDLKDGSTISMRGLKDKDTVIVIETEGITKILEMTIEEMIIQENLVMHQGIFTSPTGKSKALRLTM